MSLISLSKSSSLSSNDEAFSDSDDEDPFMFVSDGKTQGPVATQLSQYMVCAVAVKCPHKTMLVSNLHSGAKSKGLWLPYVAIKESLKLKDEVPFLLAEFLVKQLKYIFLHLIT